MTHIWMKNTSDTLLLDEQREQHESALSTAAKFAQLSNGKRDTRHVVWPEVPYYGFDHGNQTSRLAVYIAERMQDAGEAKFRDNDIHLIKAVGFYHDLGRTRPWNLADDHHARSAQLAGAAMAGDAENWVPHHVRDEVCQVIQNSHSVGDEDTPPSDPRLIALWDAECLEAARFEPNTLEGMQVIDRRFARILTPWARLAETKNRWKAHRGWK